jgi:2-polyprenyl-3-methyl-5-hydroxy-6-metoxy-1,4-benzoquinol methylase
VEKSILQINQNKVIQHLPYKINPSSSRFHHYENLWKEEAFKLLVAHELHTSGWSHLDFGCGRGETMRMAADLGMLTYGTDIDPQCLELSAKYGKVSPLSDIGLLTQFGEKSYDLVTCFHVLEHVPNPKEILLSLAKIARQCVLVAVPNLSAFHDLLRPRSKWDIPVNEGHLQAWDHAHFRNLAEKQCGLSIVEWGHDAVMLPPFTHWIENLLGPKPAIALETGPLKWLFPFASLSIIALMKPVAR